MHDEKRRVSELGATTTTDEVLAGMDLTGRRVVITGAAGGLGRESARALAAHGATVTVCARGDERAADACAWLRQTVSGAAVEPGVVDLADSRSIRSFAVTYLDGHTAIDVLINNAGVMACPFGRTVDGFETQFGTNHLGHFLLTALLSPALLAGDDPRVVTLSSGGHAWADVDLIDPNFETTPYSPWIAYGQSKTANALFARELARRGGLHGLLSFSVHPGAIITDLGRHLTDELMVEMIDSSAARSAETTPPPNASPGAGLTFKSLEAGAATQVWAATAPGLEDLTGGYLADCGPGVLGADPAQNGFLPYVRDEQHARSLWEVSEALVGSPFAL